MSLHFENITDGETVHQRCIIIRGTYSIPNESLDSFVTVTTNDDSGSPAFPTQTWPVTEGHVKVIALLSPGTNDITITREHPTATITSTLKLNYVPLLQVPPLHLAIMVAKDSPLLIDCPRGKHSSFAAHSTLDAAVAKLRMSAYMWQALTAEDMRDKGLGRRSFRLEEEWSADTTSAAFAVGVHDGALHESGAMRTTAKVHIVRSERTVKEIRDMDVAQQNPSAQRDQALFDYFKEALVQYGAPFDESARPVVAGLILDSHYSMEKSMILGHAALGCHSPKALSLGMMGSHLTYSWPRFLEEITTCLQDERNPGPTVGNDNGECGTFWEACSVGQGAMLHEVGHAFGAPHTTGIMARGYSVHWPRNFLSKTAYCTSRKQEGMVVTGETPNDARWDMKDALRFRSQPQFWLPGDVKFSPEARGAAPSVTAQDLLAEDPTVYISSPAGIARIELNGEREASPTIAAPVPSATFTVSQLEARFSREEPLELSLLGMNGKTKTVRNVWKLFDSNTFIRVPGTSLILNKKSVLSKDLEEENYQGDADHDFWTWAALLVRKNKGKVEYASSVDVRTGCILDGAYVYFQDRTQIKCGPNVYRHHGGETSYGGHAAEEVHIPRGEEIVKVEVAREEECLNGLRLHLTKGQTGGALSGYGEDHPPEMCVLEPDEGERIIGFYGRSWWGRHFDGVVEFGIITAPKDAELPDVIYKMDELKNTDGGHDAPNPHKRKRGSDGGSDSEDEDMEGDD